VIEGKGVAGLLCFVTAVYAKYQTEKENHVDSKQE
jgi:hypothetical protein